MSAENPFRYLADVCVNPYRVQPFALLGLPKEAGQANIDIFSRNREMAIRAGSQPVPGVTLRPGDCTTAASILQDQMMRLAFALMTQAGEPGPLPGA